MSRPFLLARAAGTATAVCACACAWPCLAQAAEPPAAAATAASAASAAGLPGAAAPQFHSTFSDYQRWQPQPLTDWPAANHEVGRIGGWRSYARDAQAPAPTPSAASAPASHPHAGHR